MASRALISAVLSSLGAQASRPFFSSPGARASRPLFSWLGARASRPLFVLLLLIALPAEAEPAIEWHERTGELRVCGLPPTQLAALEETQLGKLLEVHAIDAATEQQADLTSLPPLWGSYSRERDCLLFRPRHQPAPGMVLLARFRGEPLKAPPLELRVERAKPESRARVLELYPSGFEVPENLLRIYLTFSAPMSLKGIEKHVHLRDAAGNEIGSAFVEVPDGLWDPGRRRLTLFLHPGRVKSGITVGEAMGKVLVAGEEIQIEVDAAARDAEGAPLLEGFRRRLKVGPPQKQALDAKTFQLSVGPGEKAALEVEFPVALDRALALNAFTVWQGGRQIEGSVELAPGERRLSFLPAESWRRGEPYALRIGELLEDVAGNRLGRAFEVAAQEGNVAVGAASTSFVP